jgi:quercetin dioxygenase-like cupin family protein
MQQPPENLTKLEEQPVERIEEALGFCTRTITLEKAGTCIPQHEHKDDHATLVCAGKARAWADGVCLGDFEPGALIPVKAGREHLFQALEDVTRLSCIFFDRGA